MVTICSQLYLIIIFWFSKLEETNLTVFYQQVVSDKQLVKHLQKEVARLEAVLRTPDPSKEKDWKIQQVKIGK